MKTDTRIRLLDYINSHPEVTVNQLVSHFGITQASIHRHLNKLLERGEIRKFGTAPKVYYVPNISKNIISESFLDLDYEASSIIDERFIYISPLGKVYRGIEGFEEWCKKFNLGIAKTAKEYIKTLEKYDSFRQKGFINGIDKLKSTFGHKVYLDEIYYLDFYSIERFGKTKLGALVLYAKQSQSRALIKEVSDIIKDKITQIIKEKKIDAVCFIPHTLPRKVQFMNEIEKHLNLNLSKIELVKVINEIPIAQKTLSKLDDRIENASSTIFVKNIGAYKNVLIIDDAVGSGATMNESARKLKEKKVATKVIGLSLTGSYKGFEVLNEV